MTATLSFTRTNQENKNMTKEVLYGAKCDHFKEIAISSHKCRQCAHHVKYEMNMDFHGRSDTITIECSYEEDNKLKNESQK